MRRLVLGVVGHVDHGKTALVRALTGMETDRLPEERRRGMSIALGFAHADIGGQVDFVDAPGHERFVRTLVSGVTGADAILLAIDAGEGIKPQTREHLAIAALLGVREALVVVTKADLVDARQATAVGDAALALAQSYSLQASTPIVVSALTGLGLSGLRAAIAALAARAPPAADRGFACLPIDRAFLADGHGLVVTGALRCGALSPDDRIELLPAGVAVRARAVQVHGREVASAEPGQRVAVNLRGVPAGEVARGMVVAAAGALKPAQWLTTTLRLAPDAATLRTGSSLDLLIGTAEVRARVRLLDRDVLAPEETALAQLHCLSPVTAAARDGFVLRTPSPPATVAGGQVLIPAATRLRRKDPQIVHGLRALAAAGLEEAPALALAQAGARGVTIGELARLSGVSQERARTAVAALPAAVLAGDRAVLRSALDRSARQVLEALHRTPDGLPLKGLARIIPDVAPEVLDTVITRLARAEEVRVERGRVGLVRADRDRAKALAQADLARRLAGELLEGGLAPPDLGDRASAHETRRALDQLVREGVAIRTIDRVQKREILFHCAAVEAARRRLAPLLTPPGLTVGEAGRALGITRKFSVPLLEHLDAIGFTKRVGDRRILAEPSEVVADVRRRPGSGGPPGLQNQRPA